VQSKIDFFRSAFQELHGCRPFLWQERLFKDFLENRVPVFLNIPTACGKTSVMYIWLIALACGVNLPRRLVWVVNRRTIVDQATDEAERIKTRILNTKTGLLLQVRENLTKMGTISDAPLAVSTLRGELADNREWAYDPTRPSIIVGTVDMIGSRLLFSGYGDYSWHRPFHAGLLGADALIVLDEAHLVPVFQHLLKKVKEFHDEYPSYRPFHVMYLTATHRELHQAFELQEKELEEEEIAKRVYAEKILNFISCKNESFIDEICKLALGREDKCLKVIVYVWTPEDANKIERVLSSKVPGRVALLTGEMRNYERYKQMMEKPFKYFVEKDRPHQTVYLVSTSAGELGINLYADEAVCDLTPIDSMIQRLGRINRFGERKKARIDIVFEEELKTITPEDEFQSARKKTLEYLESLPSYDGEKNGSPSVFLLKPPPAEAFTPYPGPFFLTEEELFRLAMTTLSIHSDIRKELGWLPIDFYLHGEKEEAEIYFVWREEAKYLVQISDEKALKDAFKWYPIRTREKIRARISRGKKYLKKLAEKRGGEKVLQMLPTGEVRVRELSIELADDANLVNSIIIIPSELGGLREGHLDPNSEEKVKDVADEDNLSKEKRKRYLVKGTEGEWKIFKLASDELEQLDVKDWKMFMQTQLEKGMILTRPILIKADDEKIQFLIFMIEKREISGIEPVGEQELREHQKKTAEYMQSFIAKLGLNQKLGRDLIVAAIHHDDGKDIKIEGRKIWQEAIGNTNPSLSLAKSNRKYFDYMRLGGYRHELGSCIMCADILSPLSYYLIATHHGHGRPCFSAKAAGPLGKEKCDEVNGKLIKYFVELNESHGPWNIGFFESLLKAADVLATEESR